MFRNKDESHHESKEPQLPLEKKTIAPAKHYPEGWKKIGSGPTSQITQYLPEGTVNAFSRTCLLFYHSAIPTLTKRKLEKLAHYIVVEPNEDKVIALLTTEPTLVKPNNVIEKCLDASNHRTLLNNTLFQLAYGAGDDAMCLAMKPFFIEVYGSVEAGVQEMERQRDEKFAVDKVAEEKEDQLVKSHLDTILNPVIQAITQEQFDLGLDSNKTRILHIATLSAIHTFRGEFAKSQPDVIEKGMHFRNNTIQEIYNAYAQMAEQWNYRYDKCALFEDGALSCVLPYAPAVDAQEFSQGLYNRQNRAEKFARWQTLRGTQQNFYGMQQEPSVDFCLSGSGIDIYIGNRPRAVGRGVSMPLPSSAVLSCAAYSNLCQTKTANLENLFSLRHAQHLGV